MKRVCLFFLLCAVVPMTYAQNNSKWVNVFIGTKNMGHTFPGACTPYGMVQLSPDTDTIPHNVNGVYQPRAYNYCAGYQYRDSTIVGFSHTHFSGTGHSDLGDLLMMPYSGETKLTPGTSDNPDGGYRQRFCHETEVAEPGYYAVTLDDDNIRCELSTTPHCGVHRYIFPKGAAQKVILDLQHSIYNYDGKVIWAQCNVNGSNNLSGWRITNGWSRTHQLYYHVWFSKKIKCYGYHDFGAKPYKGFWHRFDVEHDFPEMGGRKPVCWFEFEEDGSDTLEVVVGLSAVSASNACEHVQREGIYPIGHCVPSEQKRGDTMAHKQQTATDYRSHFDVVKEEARLRWEQMLDRIDAQGQKEALSMLYTSLYHTMIHPSLYQDLDGSYRGINQDISYNDKDDVNYTVFSLWDTYRALHPLINLMDTVMSRHVSTSLEHHFHQSPHNMLPVWSHMGSENWCMIGYHGVSVLVDAALNTLHPDSEREQGFGLAILSSSNVDYYDHTGLYKELGYVPMDKSRNGTSVTLENAYEDWCVYRFMEQGMMLSDIIGENDSLRESYRQRALSYRNVYDTTIGFVRARYSDGTWKTPYSLLSTSGEGLIEGNAWNYSFYVPHDVNGMMRLMGGEKDFVRKLDTLFTMYIPDRFFAETEDVTREGMLGGYVHGNEPSHHIPYLYMWTSQPWKTQYWVREVMNKMYRPGIDGLCGNDDCGQMSAWYIFSAMGFYPVCPGSGEYVIGAPYLPYMKVRMGSGKYLEVKAPKVSDKNRYIRQVLWNGKPYDKCYVTYSQLMEGGVLEFVMGPKPNKRLFQSPASKPYSLSQISASVSHISSLLR